MQTFQIKLYSPVAMCIINSKVFNLLNTHQTENTVKKNNVQNYAQKIMHISN